MNNNSKVVSKESLASESNVNSLKRDDFKSAVSTIEPMEGNNIKNLFVEYLLNTNMA
ncbi:hypothetical protein [Nicoliella lavandulae]|uniref:Uncharacterized protein n=1 Tax=Nicoliella lavandulae TaxID=3082954 RepID=A0ABU8SM33_9LACO